MKRLFDFLSSSVVLICISPFALIIVLLIVLDSRGGVFFKQIRVGQGGKEFYLYKFRTMRINSEKGGQITVGSRDPRVTKVGWYLRKFKLDELPQLINILKGEMSVVGPRPEVPKYVALYSTDQKRVLEVKPGLTDYASIEYLDESTLLGKSDDPEATYIQEIMPSKLKLNLRYIDEMGMFTDVKLIVRTLLKIVELG